MDAYKTLSYNWLFVWAFLIVLAFAVNPAHATGTQRDILSIVNAPSSSFWDTGMRLCDIDANGDCHSKDYALSIVRFGAGGIAAAALSLLFFVVFIPVRFLCNGFGGKNKSYGICPSFTDRRSYTRTQILSVKVLAVIVVIPIAIAIAIGFTTNKDISNSLDTITTTLVASGDNIVQVVERVKVAVLTVSNSTSTQDTINSALETVTSVSKDLHNVDDQVDKYDGLRKGLMISGEITCGVLVVLGVICAILNLRPFAMALGLLSLLVLTIVWLAFGAHLIAGKFSYDVCVDIDLLVAGDGSTTSVFNSGALANLWKCNNNTDLVQLRNLVNSSITQAADSACSYLSQVCDNDPNWQCSPTPACGPTTLSNVTDAQHLVINDNGVPRSVASCAANCTNGNYKNASLVIVQSVATYNQFTDLYYTDVLPIVNCEYATQVLIEIRDPLCNKFSDAVFGVAVSCLIIGIFYVPFIAAMIVGFKRFRRH